MSYSYSVEIERKANGYHLWMSGVINGEPFPKTYFHQETSKLRAEGVRAFIISRSYIAEAIMWKMATGNPARTNR